MGFMIWGHRGHQHHRAPEKYPNAAYQNSAKAHEYALQHFMGLETDVIQTREGKAYLTHDTVFLDRVEYELKTHLDAASQKIVGDRFFFQLSNAEAERLRLKDGQKLSSLEDLLRLMSHYPGRMLNLELKGPNTAATALRTVQAGIADNLITADRVIFSSFNLPEMAALRQMAGNRFRLGVLLSMKTQKKTQLFPGWPGASQDACYTPFFPVEDVLDLEILKDIQPDYFHLERHSATPEDVACIIARYPQAKVSLWCVNENHPDDKDDYINIIENISRTGKLYAVMSDFPEAVDSHCRRRGLDVTSLPEPTREPGQTLRP